MRKLPLLEVNNKGEAFKKFVDYYLHGLGVGFVILVTGNTRAKIGNGKTLTGLKLAEIIEPSFSIDRFTFTPYEFLTKLNEIRENRQFYKVLILDEAEIGAASNAWYTLTSKALAAAMATFRNTKTVIIIITPMASLINSQVRKLCAVRVVPTLTLEKNKRVVHAKFYSISTDFDGDKTYHRKLRFWNNTTKRVWVSKHTKIGLPSKHLLDAYEEKDWNYKLEINRKLLKELKKLDEVETDVNKKMETIILELSRHPDLLKVISEKGKVSGSDIKSIKPDIGVQTCTSIANAMNKALRRQIKAESEKEILQG